MRETLLSLAEAMASSDPVKAKAAKREMERQIHDACRPGKPWRERDPHLKELTTLLEKRHPRLVRAHAARLIGYAGSKEEESALAKYEPDPEIGDDIQMARERLRRR